MQEINKILSERTDYESEAYQKIIEKFSELTEQYQPLGGYTIAENIEKILLGLGFSSEDFSRSTEEFSGGWRMRIELAKLLLQKHEVLLARCTYQPPGYRQYFMAGGFFEKLSRRYSFSFS